jgi:hypothetical protein
MAGARAVLQVYPHSPHEAHILTAAARDCGFNGAMFLHYPHSEYQWLNQFQTETVG